MPELEVIFLALKVSMKNS